MSGNDTARRLMDAAQDLIQERGYNAFSFKDLAERIGSRTASIHYHFPTKADLGVALMERDLEGLDESLAHIDASAKRPRTRLKALVKLYSETESAGAICLCGWRPTTRRCRTSSATSSTAISIAPGSGSRRPFPPA